MKLEPSEWTAIMIRLDQLESKIDKLLTPELQSAITGHAYLIHGNSDGKPPRWNNESYENYLKRIGECNTAQSDEEIFREDYK